MNLDQVRSFIIYHIPGRKVGCTINFRNRRATHRIKGEKRAIEIIETVFGTPQEAGDREWWWADKYGYDRGSHYADAWRSWEQGTPTWTRAARRMLKSNPNPRRPILDPTWRATEQPTIKQIKAKIVPEWAAKMLAAA